MGIDTKKFSETWSSPGVHGRLDEAREELRPVLAVNPRFAPALAVIARIEGGAGAAKGSAGR